MAFPTLTPTSNTSAIRLPKTGSFNGSAASDSHVADACPFDVYTGSDEFITGAVAQVAYTFKKLGGDVLDLEITSGSVYANYQESVLEYSYIVNLHQSINILGGSLGATTGSFNAQGQLVQGHTLSGSNVELRYPKFQFSTAFRVAEAYSTEAIIGGRTTIYSASFDRVADDQDYDLQEIVSAADVAGGQLFSGKIGQNATQKRIKVHQFIISI